MNLSVIASRSHDISNEEYHSDFSAISKSGLDAINESPAHYYYKYLSDEKPEFTQNDTLLIGSAFHMYTVQLDLFFDEYAVIDDVEVCEMIGGKSPRTTNRYKEFLNDFELSSQGKTVLSYDQFKTIKKMKESLQRHPLYKVFFKVGLAEQTFYFKDRETGIHCKIRPDWITNANGVFMVDLKSTRCSNTEQFTRSCIDYRYEVQDAFYSDGFKSVFGEAPKGFIFVAVESAAPYITEFHFMPKETRDYGRRNYKKNLHTFKDCLKNNHWPGYDNENILPIIYPNHLTSKL